MVTEIMTKIKCPHCGKVIDMDKVLPIAEEQTSGQTKPVKKVAAKKPKAKKTAAKKPVSKKVVAKKPKAKKAKAKKTTKKVSKA